VISSVRVVVFLLVTDLKMMLVQVTPAALHVVGANEVSAFSSVGLMYVKAIGADG
jgi:hypothetical protein